MKRNDINEEFQDLIVELERERRRGEFHQLKRKAGILEEKAIEEGNPYAEAVAYYFLAIYWLFHHEPLISREYCRKSKEKYGQHKSHMLYGCEH